MARLFTFLQDNRGGIFMLFFVLASIALLVQWFAWILAKGRFGATSAATASGGRAELRYIFSEATVKIINDFRHLLALIIVLIFAIALGYSLWKAASVATSATSPSVVDNMKEAIQAVVATLGGLVGSIIGYYFGESSVVKAAEPRPPSLPPDTEPIKPIKPPPPG
jgi:hypothetical protein